MAEVKKRYVKRAPREAAVPLEHAPWMKSNGTYLSGRTAIDGALAMVVEMDGKWGTDRLRLRVGPELRLKWDRQRYKFNQAVWYGEMEDVLRESGRMCAACKALDAEAVKAGAEVRPPEVWECASDSGVVVRITNGRVPPQYDENDPRVVVTYTLAEAVAVLTGYAKFATDVKAVWPEAEVVGVDIPWESTLEGPDKANGKDDRGTNAPWDEERKRPDLADTSFTLVNKNLLPREPLVEFFSTRGPLDDEIPF